MKSFRIFLLALCSLLSAGHIQAVRIALDPNYSLYDNVLQSYVNAAGLVDYMGIRANSLKDLQDVVNEFANADLKSFSYDEKCAFWLNAYNANLLLLIVNHPELKHITKQHNIFDTVLPVAKGQYTLNDIKHRIIRGKTNPKTGEGPIKKVSLEIADSRVHFALSDGSIGGAELSNFAYTSQNLEQALRKDSIEFVNSKEHLRLEKGVLKISRLMNDYADDFEKWGGPASYLNRLVDTKLREDGNELKKHLLTHYKKAEFISDSTLNDIREAETKRPKLLNAPK